MPKSVLAIFAHPDDIEFVAAGTMLLLAQAGYALHYFNLCNGCCGSSASDAQTTAQIRLQEAINAAEILDASFYEPIENDLELVYSVELLKKVASVVRIAQPEIVLTHSPRDYMEDHMFASRLAVTAAFSRGMPNFQTLPNQKSFDSDVAVYHALPHGLKDGIGQTVSPEFLVDTETVQAKKRAALAAHQSQKQWLDESQGMDSYLETMDQLSRQVASLSEDLSYAEGWRQHTHLGFSAKEDFDPLRDALSRFTTEL